MLSRTVLQWHYEVHTTIIMLIFNSTFYSSLCNGRWKLFFQRFDEDSVVKVLCLKPCTDRQLLAAEEQRMAERSAICDTYGKRQYANNDRTSEGMGSKIRGSCRNLR